MICKITAGGSSFKGAFQYYLHDKGRATRERVAWTHTENLLTDDPDKAWKVMAYTAKEADRLKEATSQKRTGRKLTLPVFAYSLAWHPEQQPDREHMLTAARKSLADLGLAEHEAVIVAHRDEPQKHVHVIVNRVHPLTGLAAGLSNSKLKLSDFAREYEQEHGKVYCRQREANHQKRTQGERTVYRNPHIAAAWEQSDNGRGFAAALRDKGYQLAQGRKRLVVIDPYGQSINPLRHLENVRTKEFNKRLQDLEPARLPDATAVSRKVQADNRRRYEQSREHDEQIARQKNQMQSRHAEQRAQTFNRYEDRLSREKTELAQHYRLDEQQAAVAQQQAKSRNPALWKKLFGLARKDQIRLEELELNLQDAQRRMQERLGQIEAERTAALAKLQEKQEAEKRLTVERAERARPTGYVNEEERELMKQFLQSKRADRSRGESSLEL
ncbi:MAG: relaxase/mobilization nuclease domain-containing protein [Verrucomicrobiales bacterium]|nr:relaxase/mobilization nuclease domain-containing protein [Verrucomicrobiales bacterium]